MNYSKQANRCTGGGGCEDSDEEAFLPKKYFIEGFSGATGLGKGDWLDKKGFMVVRQLLEVLVIVKLLKQQHPDFFSARFPPSFLPFEMGRCCIQSPNQGCHGRLGLSLLLCFLLQLNRHVQKPQTQNSQMILFRTTLFHSWESI